MERIIDISTFEQVTDHIDEHISNFFNQISYPDDATALIDQIESGKVLAVTDASVMPETNTGASSFVITTIDLHCVCASTYGVPHGSERMDSYRAVLYGIFSILCTLKQLVKEHHIDHGSITIACDNKASLENALLYDERAGVTLSSFDVLWAIHNLRQNLPIQIIPQHVKGHQDRRQLKRPLILLEKLNCYVDLKAGEYRKYIEHSTTYQYSHLHFFSNWTCKISDVFLTTNLDKRIKRFIYSQQMQDFLHNNKGYSLQAFAYIDWNAIEIAAHTLTLHRQIWLTKFVSGFCATAMKMHERGKWKSPLCPLCNMNPENTKHVIICTDTRATDKYRNLLHAFVKFLERINTHPGIVQLFHSSLYPQRPTSFLLSRIIFNYDNSFQSAAKQQDQIGWHNLFKGHLSSEWKQLQLSYLNQMFTNPPSVDSWLKQVILQIYNFSFSMWENRNYVVHEHTE